MPTGQKDWARHCLDLSAGQGLERAQLEKGIWFPPVLLHETKFLREQKAEGKTPFQLVSSKSIFI